MQAESSTSCGQKESSHVIFDDILYGKCRCCLIQGRHQHFGNTELNMLMENLNLFLMADPRMPSLICSDCVTLIEDVQRFRQKVMASEKELLRIITEEIKSENMEQSQNDPLAINQIKIENEFEQDLSADIGTGDDDTEESKIVKVVKIEFEPEKDTLKEGKRKTVKMENESYTQRKTNKQTNKECIKSQKHEPKSGKVRSVPLTGKMSQVPKTGKQLRLIPLNSKSMVPQSSKGIQLVPISSKGAQLVQISSKIASSKGLRLLPVTSKGLHLVPIKRKMTSQSSEDLLHADEVTDVETMKEEVIIAKENKKRKIKDDSTDTISKKKKCVSKSDTFESDYDYGSDTTEEKVGSKADLLLASLETARHLLLKDNSKVRSNIILLLKHSTITPFRNNFKYAFKCFYCDKLYTAFKELKEHIETDHDDVTEATISKIVRTMQNLIVTADISCIKCKLCEERCESIENLIHHLSNVHEKVYHETDRKPSHGILGVDLSTDTLKCHICNQDHTFFKNLLVHMNEHYGVFVCYVCGKKFLSERRYKSHVISTHENNDIKCKECSKVFKTEPAMKYHVKRVHLKTRVKCLYCPETFTSGNYVKRLNHMAEVHGVAKPVFKCDICNKELANSASLAHHKMYTHKRTKVNRCELCGYMTCSNTAMKNHMIVHSGEKNHECEICKKTFAKLGTLKLHLKIHFNDRRFACFLCDAAFIQKNSLKNHLRSKHPDSGIDVNNLPSNLFQKS